MPCFADHLTKKVQIDQNDRHAKKRHKPEQIVTLLRKIEVEIANGKTTPQAYKEAEITVRTFYRWRKEFGGL